jgi:hypothetical protein
LIDAARDTDPNSKDTEEIASIFDKVDESCALAGFQFARAAGSGVRAMTLLVLLFGEFLIEFL